MRWLPTKLVLVACFSIFALAGCQGGGEEQVPKQVLLNPSGKPQNEQEQKQADVQAQAGNHAAEQMATAHKQMEEAKKRDGTK